MKGEKGGRLVTDYRGRIYDAKTLGLLERKSREAVHDGGLRFLLANEVRATKLAQANSGCGVFWKAKCMRWVDSLPQPPWPSTRVS